MTASTTSALPSVNANGSSNSPSSQIVRRDARWEDLERLRTSHPMMDAVIDEVRGRRIRVGSQWLSDFAS